MTRLVWTLPDGSQTARWAEDPGGGGATPTLLGPFPVTWEDQAALEGDGLVLAQIDAGTCLVEQLCIVTELWDGATGVVIQLGFGAPADWGIVVRWDILGLIDHNVIGAASWRASVGQSLPILFPTTFDPAGDAFHNYVGGCPLALTAGQLRAAGFFTGTPTAGAVDIYAVVASAA